MPSPARTRPSEFSSVAVTRATTTSDDRAHGRERADLPGAGRRVLDGVDEVLVGLVTGTRTDSVRGVTSTADDLGSEPEVQEGRDALLADHGVDHHDEECRRGRPAPG